LRRPRHREDEGDPRHHPRAGEPDRANPRAPVVLRLVFFAFLLLALLGDARVFLFVINHLVFGSHRQEKSRWHWLLYAVPPLLLALTALFWPLNRWIEWLLETRAVERITPERLGEIAWSLALAKVGAAWLIAAAGVGSYWILERIRVNYLGEPPLQGIRTAKP